ncbi:MAG: hypothetical protein V3T24_04510, partial [Longimicrobiales bacterium]
IFVWTARRFLEEVRGNAPEIAEHLPLLDAEKPDEFFSSVPVTAVDVAIMERSDRVVTIAATFEWDDVGSWESLSRTLDADVDGNVSLGEAYVMDGTDNIVYGSVEPVVLYGVEGLVVVRTPDATLITTRDKAPGLKAALDRLPPHVRGADSE